jgi:hypothetical protein
MNMMSVRRWHSYLGLFMAPSVLFFALSGAVQLFSLHEAHGSYRPAALVEKLSSVHKDQVFRLGHHHEPAPDAESSKGGQPGGSPAPEDADTPEPATLALKTFFLVVALCLILSSALGLWIGLTQTRHKRVTWALVLAGALIPAALVLAA